LRLFGRGGRVFQLPARHGVTRGQQMAAVADLEEGLISSRTKAALAAANARGKKLGGNRGVKLTATQGNNAGFSR
jgi:DNA invertase Pin-like site-specific DNA recombinase